MEINEGSMIVPEKRVPEPYFLKRLLGKNFGDVIGPHGLLFVAVHEMFLESGFIGFDSVSGMRSDRFDLPTLLLSEVVSMSYTLPELLNDRSSYYVTEFVSLKYQTLGHFVNVYGSLAKSDAGMHKLCLNAYEFGPVIGLVWATSDKDCSLQHNDQSLSCRDEVFEFYTSVKNGFALPLLLDLCDKAGLRPPACWMHLPRELKLKILECLPGVDVAKMECVSREMRCLASSNNELWKQKFIEELEIRSDAEWMTSWKDRFVFHRKYNQKRKMAFTPWCPCATTCVSSSLQLLPCFNEGSNFCPFCNLGRELEALFD